MAVGITSIFKFPLRILKITGMWPLNASSRNYKIFAFLGHIIFIELFMVFQIGYYVKELKAEDYAALMVVIPSDLIFIYKNLNLLNRMIQTEELIQDVQDLTNRKFCDSAILVKYEKIAKNIFKTYIFGGLVMSTGATLSTIFRHKWIVKMWLPFNLNQENEIVFWIVTFYQGINIYVANTINLIFDIMPVFFMIIIVGMLKELGIKFGNIKKHTKLNEDGSINVTPKKDNKKMFAECIETQIEIIRIIDEMQNIFSMAICLQKNMSAFLVRSTVLRLIFVSFETNTSLFITYIVFMMIVLIRIFLPCYYGNEIKLKWNQLSELFFMSDWWTEKSEYQKTAKIFMQFMKKPKYIRSCSIFIIDMDAFRDICKSAYSIYAIFKRN